MCDGLGGSSASLRMTLGALRMTLGMLRMTLWALTMTLGAAHDEIGGTHDEIGERRMEDVGGFVDGLGYVTEIPDRGR